MVRANVTRFWPLAVLLLLFAGSIGLRWGSFGLDPLRDHRWTTYERFNNLEVYEHNHYVGKVYDENPVAIHKFAGYIGSGSDFLLNKKENTKGDPLTIYTSFPPTHFIVLYETLRLFGSDVSFFGIQMVSLAIHLLCIVLMYYLCYVLTKNRYVSVLSATIYIFSTLTLQQHMNVYWAHQLLMPVFLGSLILFVKRKGLFTKWEALAIGFSLSIIAWTGLFAAAGYALYGGHAYLRTKNKRYKNYVYMAAGAMGALAAIVWQVLWVTGTSITDYLGHVASRGTARSSAAGHMPIPRLLWLFVNDLLIDLGLYAIIAWTLAMIRRFKGFEWAVVFVAGFPIVESALLLEHDEVYGFGRLKWLVPIIVTIAICGNRYVTTTKQKIIFTTAIILANLVHAGLYLVVYMY